MLDSTTLEATAALRSIVRRDTGETYNDFLTKLAQGSGIETPTREDLAKLDRKRKNIGSNQDWTHPPHDPVAVTLQEADQGDTTAIQTTLPEAVEQLEAVAAINEKVKTVGEVVTDTGYHSKETVLDMQSLGLRT